jgi:hypothetical protein
MATLIDTTPGGTARGRVGSREVRWDWTDAGSFLKWLQRECPISEKPAVQQPPFGCRVCRNGLNRSESGLVRWTQTDIQCIPRNVSDAA